MATRAVFSAMTTTGARNAPVVTGHRRGGRRATTQKVRMTARNGWTKDDAVFKELELVRDFDAVGSAGYARTRAGWGGERREDVVKGGTAAFGAVWAVTRRGEAGDL